MGWDIVTIGIRHKLPITNPIETTKILSPLIDGIISIGYYQNIEHNENENTVCRINDKWKELTSFDAGRKGQKYLFEIKNEYVKQVFLQVASIDNVSFDDYTKEMFLVKVIDESDVLYELSCDVRPSKYYDGIRLYKENVDFSRNFGLRWFSLEGIFRKPYEGECKRALDEFRKAIFEQSRVCGCDCAYYFPDQSYGELLWNAISKSSDDWISYLKSRRYIDDDQNYVFFDIKDYISGERLLEPSENVICFIDDFSDLRN